MFFPYNYKRHGLPYGLINIHEFLLKDIFAYFEKGAFVRKKVKTARKAVKGAIRYARRKKVYPSTKTALTLNVLRELLDEIEYTHSVAKATAAEMENMLQKIKEEMIDEILPLIEDARAEFRKDDLKSGVDFLKEAQEKLKNKYLVKTRKEILGGFDSDVKRLKKILMAKRITPPEKESSLTGSLLP